MRQMRRKRTYRNRDRMRPRRFPRWPVADRQFAVARVTDAISVKVGLVWVDGIGAVVLWARTPIKPYVRIAETVTVCVGTRVAVIHKSI